MRRGGTTWVLVGPSRSFEMVFAGMLVYVDSPCVSVGAGLMRTRGEDALDYGDVLSSFPFTSFVGERVDLIEAGKAFVCESHNEKYVKKP